MHASQHKSRRENHRQVVFTQQEMIYLRTPSTHLLADNKLVSSVCFPKDFFCFCLQKFFWFRVTLDSYSDICYLGTDELIIFVSFLWMIWVDLPFLIYRILSIHCCGVNLFGGVPCTHFSFCSLCFFILCFAPFLSRSPPFFFIVLLIVFISIQYASCRFPGSFSLIISPNSGFSFCYVSSMAFFLKRHFRRHACISTQK